MSLDPTGTYTDAEVEAELHASRGVRTLSFRFDRLDSSNNLLGPLDSVLSASVENNMLADIKRTAKFSLVENGGIDYLRDRIRPWARLRMPGDAVTHEWMGTPDDSRTKRVDLETGEERYNYATNPSFERAGAIIATPDGDRPTVEGVTARGGAMAWQDGASVTDRTARLKLKWYARYGLGEPIGVGMLGLSRDAPFTLRATATDGIVVLLEGGELFPTETPGIYKIGPA